MCITALERSPPSAKIPMMSRRACRLAESGFMFPVCEFFLRPGVRFLPKITSSGRVTGKTGAHTLPIFFSTVARDSQGRIYRENRHFAPGSTLQPLEEKYFVLLDPIAHTRTRCTPKTRRCTVGSWKASTTFSPTRIAFMMKTWATFPAKTWGKTLSRVLT